MIRGDTIAAIATASGRAGVAVVRVSGPDAFAVVARLTGREASPGRIAVADVREPGGTALDQAVVLAFRGPRSYTGEDVVEFQCHGGSVTPRRILEACFSAGARQARRGEFTERAFLNGKLDYDQAESVLDLIHAKTSRAADMALEGLAGRKRREARRLYDAALELSSQIEHSLDVDEGELPPGFVDGVRGSCARLRDELAQAIRKAAEGKLLRTGALVVLAGRPNVGKSSLMNALLEENRAIVSDVPGTTRDVIEEWLDLDGWPIRLVDTAGLRETDDRVEAEGVRRARDLMARADVVLRLREASEGAGAADAVRPASEIEVLTKCDLADAPAAGTGGALRVSAKAGTGLDELRSAIVARLRAKAEQAVEEPCDDLSCLHEAQGILQSADGLDDLVLLANAVRRAAETLGSALGATYSSDLLDRLFSRFCVGK